MRSSVLVLALAGANLCGCGLLDGTESAPGLVEPPASKVAQTPPVQRPAQPGAKIPTASKATPKAATGADAKGENTGDLEDIAAGDEPNDADDSDVEEPTKRKRARDDSDDSDDSDAPRKKKDLSADLFVKRLVIAKNVKGREPVGATNSFSQGAQDRIYAFVEVGNRDQVASEIYISFIEKSSGKGQRVPLKIGAGSRWRTWVYTRNATKPGKWFAVVKNAKGKTLASQSFEITGKASDGKKSKAKTAGDKASDDKAKKKKKSADKSGDQAKKAEGDAKDAAKAANDKAGADAKPAAKKPAAKKPAAKKPAEKSKKSDPPAAKK